VIKPFKRIVLIEILEEESKKGQIYLGRPNSTNFDKALVVEVGPDVKDIKKGDTVYVHKVWEPIEVGAKIGFIAEDRIFAKIEDEPLDKN